MVVDKKKEKIKKKRCDIKSFSFFFKFILADQLGVSNSTDQEKNRIKLGSVDFIIEI